MEVAAILLNKIFFGESENIEFKREPPKDHKKYLKTVIAFANGFGGKIIFGVEDNTLDIVGINNDEAFKIKDSITNAIYANCKPTIIPNVYLETINNKTVVVVEINSGWQKPYHIKADGIENGTYIRVAGTTRLADILMIKELMFEGSNRFYDKTICPELTVSDKDINELCDTLKEVAKRNCNSNFNKDNVELLTKNQLISWGLLVLKEGKVYPTNAYAILTGSPIISNTIQCALFKGNDRTEVIDMKNFSGPIYELIDYAYQFVLRNIKMKATFDGLYRNNEYEIPTYAIRELIVNAVAHRSYLDRNNIKIALYDDRLEVTSPGKLPMGQTLEKMKNGNSTIRNEALVHILQYLNYIEAWGRGIPRIIKSVTDIGLAEPSFIGGETELVVNIYRYGNSYHISDQTLDYLNQLDQTIVLGANERKILDLILANNSITQKEITIKSNFSISQVKYYTGKLMEKGVISRDGTNRKGKWIINKFI